jgi:hypothetical protein
MARHAEELVSIIKFDTEFKVLFDDILDGNRRRDGDAARPGVLGS